MEFLKTVVEKLGFDADTLTKIEKNELSVDDAVNGYVSKIEKTTADRLAKQIEDAKMPEIYSSVYAKTEKALAEEFGLDVKQYETVDKKERLKTMIADLKKKQSEAIENTKKEFTSADAQKLQQLTQQLEMANSKLSEKEQLMQAAILAEQNKLKDYIKNQHIEKVKSGLIESVKDARLEPKVMRAVIEAEMAEKGYTTEIDADGNIWINKDGNRVKHPAKPTENLKYETLFEIIATENSFSKKSNGGEGGKVIIDDKAAQNVHPNFIKHIQNKYGK